MIKFMHTADIHFGMENYGKIDQQTGIHSRLLDFNNALNFCIDKAIEHDVDFFLFSGDAYKTTNPSPTHQKLLLSCFLRLYKAGIPIVIVVGNHDNPLSFGKAHALDIFGALPLDGFHVIAKPTSFVLNTKRGPTQIVGIPWPTRNNVALASKHLVETTADISTYISEILGAIIESYARDLDPQIPAVLAGHLTVSSGIFSGSEKRAIYGNDPVLLPSQLALAPFDYVALGHLHRHQNLNSHGTTPIVYAGSIERVDFGERKEDKGCCLVTIEEKGKTSYEFIKTPMRPFIQVEVSLDAGPDQTKQILEALQQHSLADAVVKVIYHIPAGKKDMVDLPALQRACAQAIHLINIVPVHVPQTRIKRALSHVNMDVPSLLTAYFQTQPTLKDRATDLTNKALALLEEHAQQVEE